MKVLNVDLTQCYVMPLVPCLWLQTVKVEVRRGLVEGGHRHHTSLYYSLVYRLDGKPCLHMSLCVVLDTFGDFHHLKLLKF